MKTNSTKNELVEQQIDHQYTQTQDCQSSHEISFLGELAVAAKEVAA